MSNKLFSLTFKNINYIPPPQLLPHLHIFIDMRKKGRKLGTCTCSNCGIEFEKPLSEIIRNEKLNRKNFCSRTCVGKHNVKNLPKERVYDISIHSKWRIDEYTKFRYHYRNILTRDKLVEVTIDDLKEVWEKQNGICPYLNVKLTLSSFSKIEKDPILSASLDRIDSNKGYVKGNLQWISRAMNYLKNNMSNENMNRVINLIKNQGINPTLISD